MKIARCPVVLFILLSFLMLLSHDAYGVLVAVDSQSKLYEVNTSDVSLSLIGNTGVSCLGAIEFSPDGILYGQKTAYAGSCPLYTINTETGAATQIASYETTREGALAFSPDGTLYGTYEGPTVRGILYRTDPKTLIRTDIGKITIPNAGTPHDISGLAWRSDGMLAGLDNAGESLVLIDPNNATGSVLKDLGLYYAGMVGGMTSADGETGYFCWAKSSSSTDPNNVNKLYTFDLYSGDFTHIGDITITQNSKRIGITGLAAGTIPENEPAPELGTILLLGSGLGAFGLGNKRLFKRIAAVVGFR